MDIGSVDSSRGVQQIQQLQSQVVQERANETASQQVKEQTRDSVELSKEAESALQAIREKDAQAAKRADASSQRNADVEETEREEQVSEPSAARGGNINDLSAILNSGQAQKGELVDTQA